MKEKTPASFRNFEMEIQDRLLSHRVIKNNEYCKWFSHADPTFEEVRYFVQQFSVFSNLFLVAQLHKMINAVDLEEMRAAKEILANEIGCVFAGRSSESAKSKAYRKSHPEEEGDPTLVNTEGTVDGGTFRFRAAHFEWLLNFAAPLDLKFQDMGKRRHGSPSTLFFCDELVRIYGSEDFNEAAGASFAVENWAAAGFWKELIQGLKQFKSKHLHKIPLSFFTWHDKVEDQHKEHTLQELKSLFMNRSDFNEEKFILAGIKMLDGVSVFWEGLNAHRLEGDLKLVGIAA